jgi:hypothetical protein
MTSLAVARGSRPHRVDLVLEPTLITAGVIESGAYVQLLGPHGIGPTERRRDQAQFRQRRPAVT